MLKRTILLNKIEEADEGRRKNEMSEISGDKSITTLTKVAQKEMKKTVNVMENARIRWQSARGMNDVKPWKPTLKKRPNSTCVFKKLMSQYDTCFDRITRSSCLNIHPKQSSPRRKNWLTHLNRQGAEQQKMQRWRSTSNISGSGVKVSSQVFYKDDPLSKFKRSLRLLGSGPPDFDTYFKETPQLTSKKTRSLPTLSTKLIRRTVSLNSLKEAVREAWADDCLGFHQRKILSQAVYEEWYFRKEREWQIKQKEKKAETFRNREKICQDFIMKKVRAEEEFRKWAQRKRKKSKENDESSIKTFEKTKEEIEKAFLKWKKDKDKELRENNQKKKREEENNRESEKQKMERKIVAEKAFQQWKNKVYELKKCEKEKKKEKQERFEKRQKSKRDSQISFQIWKAIKDKALRQNSKEMRNTTKVKRKERIARMEERVYEAEQAFEEWLEKKSFRKQTNTETRQKNIPWIPV